MRLPRRLIIRAAILAAFVSTAASACGGDTSPGTPPASVASSSPSATPPSAPPVALTRCPVRTVPWDGTSPLDLTGAWSVDGHGMYYISQIDDAVWWIGLSGLDEPAIDAGNDWANAFKGTLKGTTISGTYVDVPKGDSGLNGPVVLEIRRSPAGAVTLVRTNPDSETQFGGMVFTPCTAGRS